MTDTLFDIEIDELSVTQVVKDGMRMKLQGEDRNEAFRRMYGRIEMEQIAWRLYMDTDTCRRLTSKLKLKGGYKGGRALLNDEYARLFPQGWDWWRP